MAHATFPFRLSRLTRSDTLAGLQMTRHFGVTVMPEYIQTEGIEAVLARLCRAGVTSVTTSPYVAAETDAAHGGREPPADGGAGGVRLLDRPVWGKRELYLQTAPSFVPDPARYAGLRYQPPPATDLTHAQGNIIGAFLDAASAAGLSTHLQVMAAIPPGLRVQFGGPVPSDRPTLPDGGFGPGRVDNNASLATLDVRRYMAALIGDLCENYPQATGIKFDWPEIPPYDFHSLLFDFNPAVRSHAEQLGLDFDDLASRVQTLFIGLANFGDAEAISIAARLGSGEPVRSMLTGNATITDLLRLRRALVGDYQKFLADAVRAASHNTTRVFFQGFPPPWNEVSGFDFAVTGGLADDVGAKIYSMHWPMMEKNYCEALLGLTPLSEAICIRLVRALLGTTTAQVSRIDQLRYPAPEESHPADSASIESKLNAARQEVTTARFWALSHSYGPLEDVARRFQAALAGSNGNVYLNRYGYLSDEKLDTLGSMFAYGPD